MFKKTICLILSLIFVFSLCSCKDNSTSSVPEKTKISTSNEIKKTPINLLYNKADSLNPYTAVTVNNRNICKLIFEPLVKADSNFKPVYRLAKKISLNGEKCTVTIIDTKFTDGTMLTASDIIYSYNKAKKSKGIYASHLYEVKSVYETDNKTVVFVLSKNDPYFKNLLDFPIFKANSDTKKDSDGVLLSPIGCGRYIPNKAKDTLTINKNFFGKKGQITKINLINAPDEDSESHYIEVGATQMYFSDLKDGKLSRMSGKRVDVNLNNLVYLGINLKSSNLSNRYLRYAISSGIDRNAVSKTAFYGNATPATGYFNPNFEDVKSVQSLKDTADLEITVENLKKIGYTYKDSDGYYTKKGYNHHTYKLIVNSENVSRVLAADTIATQLKNAGISVSVSKLEYKQYLNAIKKGHYDLYIGEISILPNFDVSQLVISGGSVSYGVTKDTAENKKTSSAVSSGTKTQESKTEKSNDKKKNTPTAILNIISEYDKGSATIKDVAGTLLTEMVQIPIVYKKGLYFYSDEIVSGVTSAESDIYYSIENYKLIS